MNPDLHMERPLTRRECHAGLNRQEFSKWGNLFKKIASDLDNDNPLHLTLGDFPVSECKVKLARISTRRLYVYVSKRNGRTTNEIKNVLKVGSGRVHQLLGKVQIEIRTVEKVVGKAVLEDFLDQYTEELMRSLEEDIKAYNDRLEKCRNTRIFGVKIPQKKTSFFYILDGCDVFERFN